MVSTNVVSFREIQIQFKFSNGSQLEEPKTTFKKHIPKPHSEPKNTIISLLIYIGLSSEVVVSFKGD